MINDQTMTPAEAAAKVFYETLQEKGRRVDSATLRLAWERAAAEAISTWEQQLAK